MRDKPGQMATRGTGRTRKQPPTPRDADAPRPVDALPAFGPLGGQFTSLATLPIEDRAYALHLRGHSLREIAARLGIDKDTAHKYVRMVASELAPLHTEQREALRQETIARLRAIAATAGDRFDESPEPALLNTQMACEREIARLEGLYDPSLEIAAAQANGGMQITVRYVNDWRGRSTTDERESDDHAAAES